MSANSPLHPRTAHLSAAATHVQRPIQDVTVTSNQASQFPGIGMTLPSYTPGPGNRPGRIAGSSPPVKPKKRRITLKRVVITLLIIVLLLGGYVGGKFLYNAHKLFGGNILGLLQSTKLQGEDEGRVNILLAGNSADDPGHNGAELTDSIMLLSLDTKNNKAFMLSIPRDLWIEIDGSGHKKINEAYVTGEEEGFSEGEYPDGGMGQLEQVVSESFGLPIHYYALVDYQAFKQSVDAVGGIDLTIKSADPRGLYDPNIDWETRGPLVKLTNGPHHLNGRQALNLARARGDSYRSYGFNESDFTRTKHQREMLVALKSKAVSAGVLANPAKVTSLFDSIGNNVETDFQPDEVRRLYDLVKKINNNSIQSLSLNDANGVSLLESYRTPRGQSALVPAAGLDDFTDIQAFINRQTSSNPVVQEGAKIVVLNGTDVNGLASKVKKKLTTKNMVVTKVGDAMKNGSATTIIDNSAGKKPATKTKLIEQFKNNVTTVNPYKGIYEADFIIVLGADQVTATNPAPASP